MASSDSKTPTSDSDELSKRRDRLNALKAKRPKSSSDDPAPAAPPQGGAARAGQGPFQRRLRGGGGGGGGGGGPGQAGGANRARQRKMLMKVYNVLTRTPEDEHGYVADTPFTEAGVARLMQTLEGRSADPSAPGARVAAGVLRYLKAKDGEDATASGASLEKLRMVARQVDRFRNKRN